MLNISFQHISAKLKYTKSNVMLQYLEFHLRSNCIFGSLSMIKIFSLVIYLFFSNFSPLYFKSSTKHVPTRQM